MLTADELAELAYVPDASVPSAGRPGPRGAARVVRGPEVEVEGILSAKTGGCPEDCHFCSQSSQFDTPVKATPFLDTEEVLSRGPRDGEARRVGVLHRAGRQGPRRADDGAHPRAGAHHPATRPASTSPCRPASSPPSRPERLAEGGVHRYNHNLETSRSYFPEVVTTHSFDDRVNRPASWSEGQRHGAVLRSAAGHGRDRDQRLELLEELRAVDPTEVPVNFLNPRPGTPMGDYPIVGAMEAIRWIALFRLALPGVILRYAGGREVTLRRASGPGS
jgi:biotin synthase